MGGGTYSSSERTLRAHSHGYYTKPASEVFHRRSVNSAMNPHGVQIRESRDSAEHPASLAIVIGLDVTGSMGSVPHHLIKDGLPDLMDQILKAGIKDPQVLFMGIGDHECDSFPLQVSQFESSDELLDKWLTETYLEGGGGSNAGESYLLAWYFAAQHTAIDCLEKRRQKGILFTIGDEPVLKNVPSSGLKSIMGDGQYENSDALTLLDKARQKYHVFHIHIAETAAGSKKPTVDGWKQILGDNLLVADHHQDVSRIIAETITRMAKAEPARAGLDTEILL